MGLCVTSLSGLELGLFRWVDAVVNDGVETVTNDGVDAVINDERVLSLVHNYCIVTFLHHNLLLPY